MSKEREHGSPDRPKQRHETHKEAEQQLWSLVRDTGARRHALTVYRCKFCGGYHVGHRRKRRYQR
jgi:predicted restriction endonuclease